MSFAHSAVSKRVAILIRNCRTTEKWIWSLLLLAIILPLCVYFLDVPVALFVKTHLYRNSHWNKWTSNLPDLLFMTVLGTTLAAFSIYLVRSKKGIYDAATCFAKLVTWAAPASFLAKALFKIIFGRVNTRYWLLDPDLYGFYWFQRRTGCDGFPSGHMVVMVTLFAALYRFHPKSRPACIALSIMLATALVLTNYHFVSDVIAGAYLGVVIEALAFRILLHDPLVPESSAL
jgi:membrane-associated phospholipid phosphatase